LGTEEKRGTTFRNSKDEIFETLTGNNKTRSYNRPHMRTSTATV